MKLTDLALIFVIILFPIIVIVYVNTSFITKAEKEEMYYRTVIDSAITDATNQMKKVENNDLEIDYGYSGNQENKVSVNSTIAISTFYNSLFNNFGIKGNNVAEERLKTYIPVIAVLDYDGIYIHSAEKVNSDGTVKYVTKPKQYYTYTYVIDKLESGTYAPKEVSDSSIRDIANKTYYQATFTMDDYIYIDTYKETDSGTESGEHYAFYLNNDYTNYVLTALFANVIVSEEKEKLNNNIIDHLEKARKETISRISMEAISQAVNKHNDYAKKLGLTYKFQFSVDSDTNWYEKIEGIGMLAVVQGISLGNRYLNYKAYSVSSLMKTKKYYLSNDIDTDNTHTSTDNTYLKDKLYHASAECPIYKEYIFRNRLNYTSLIPKYYYNKSEAANSGYIPCPICKP